MAVKNIPIPEAFRDIFEQEQRHIIVSGIGIYLANIKDLIKTGAMEKLAKDKVFNEHYHIVFVPKG